MNTKLRIRVTSKLPLTWPRFPGLKAQTTIGVGHGRLRAKLLIFDTPKALAEFWQKRMGHALGKHCLGVVNALQRHVTKIGPDGSERQIRIEVDARFFCVIGLCRKHLTMNIISHECVHAGFAFARRRSRSPWDAHALQLDEEAIAYPAGELARRIVLFMNSHRLS